MSHASGLEVYDREDPKDLYYNCKYNNSMTLEDCISEHLFDATLKSNPGTTTLYNNEAFDILAAIIVRKTSLMSYGQALAEPIMKPLGMDFTTVDCSVTQSTSMKPHIACGICSTAHDMAKLVQMLGNNGMTSDGNSSIVLPSKLHQIFSSNTGSATWNDPILGINSGFPYSRCYALLWSPDEPLEPYSLMGYGLGTMMMSGTKGIWLTHAGSKRGYWAVALGRFAAYFGWQHKCSYPAYSVIAASLLDTLEQSNSFFVTHRDNHGGDSAGDEIEMCGGGNLCMNWFARMGYDSTRDLFHSSCGRRLGEASPWQDLGSQKDMEQAMRLL